MKKFGIILGAVIALAALAAGGTAFFTAQRADYGWSPGVATPTFSTARPVVLFDEAHHNASSIGFSGRYWPFGRLLRADGFAVTRGRREFSRSSLQGVAVLVIANASGAPKPQMFGLNLPSRTDRKRGDPAFTPEEIRVVHDWVAAGGSLLFIADHAPFGQAASGLADALGVTMHRGFVEVPGELSDPLLFSSANGRLGDHPIIRGDGPATALSRVMTYTGQSLDGPPDATILLRLPANAVEAVPRDDTLVEAPAGAAQGLAFAWGRGRVVVLGEAGMLTAQVFRGQRYGLNAPDNDNRQLVLNAMHWLARRL